VIWSTTSSRTQRAASFFDGWGEQKTPGSPTNAPWRLANKNPSVVFWNADFVRLLVPTGS